MPTRDPLQDAKRIVEETKERFSDYEDWMKHNGMRILVNSYTGMDVSEIPDAITANMNAIKNRKRTGLRVLVDISDVYANKEILGLFKKAGSELAPYISRSAVIGALGVQKYFLNIVNAISGMNTRAFNTRDEALEWLTKL